MFTPEVAASKRHWEQNVFPIGNGRLGGTIFGDPQRERIQFNEDSSRVGNEHCTGGYRHHAAVRSLAFKWIRILFRCWKNGEIYDEDRDVRQLQKRQVPYLEFLDTA